MVLGLKTMFLSSSTQSHAESSRNFVKDSVLDPKRAKMSQKSPFGVSGGRPGGRPGGGPAGRRRSPVAGGRRWSPAVGAGRRRSAAVGGRQLDQKSEIGHVRAACGH